MKFNFIDYLGETPWNLTPFPSPYQEKGCLILYRTQVKTAIAILNGSQENTKIYLNKQVKFLIIFLTLNTALQR